MKVSSRDHRFQNLTTSITYSNTQQTFIDSLKPFQGNEWDKSFKGSGRRRGSQITRDRLKGAIRVKLLEIQYPHCIYCGFHEKIVGHLQREHIAPKDLYRDFVFTETNLVLACASCNGFLKKSSLNTVSAFNTDYSKCKFKIIHPYRDRYQDHYIFRFSNKELVISPVKYSRKGKNTIAMFGLNDIHQASLRGAAIIKSSIKLTSRLENLVQQTLLREYVR